MAGSFRYDLIPAGTKVLCALSGGADSMYLLCRLMEGAEQGGYAVHAAHYNHQLRAAAGRDEEFVRNWCADRGISLTAGRGDVRALAEREGVLWKRRPAGCGTSFWSGRRSGRAVTSSPPATTPGTTPRRSL